MRKSMSWTQERNKNQAAVSEGGRRWCARRKQLGLIRSRTHSKDKTKAVVRWVPTTLPDVQARGGNSKSE